MIKVLVLDNYKQLTNNYEILTTSVEHYTNNLRSKITNFNYQVIINYNYSLNYLIILTIY